MKLGALVREVRDLCEPSEGSATPYVGLEHIGKGTLALAGVGVAGDVTSTKKAFRRGDILFGSLRPYLRKVVKVRFDGVCSTDITVLRPTTKADASFAFYAIASHGFIDRAARVSNGTRMPRAPWEVLSSTELGRCSPRARRRIGETLAAYDDLIDNNARRIEALEEMTRTIHREWFGRREAPQGWTPGTLADRVDFVRDSVDPRSISPETPYFGLEHLPRRSTTLRTWGRADEATSQKLGVAPGDILFGTIRPHFHKVGVSPVSGVCSHDAVVLRPRRAALRAVVLGCVSSDAFVARASASAQGAKMPRANWALLRAEPLPLPPESVLRRYDDLAGSAVRMAMALGLQTRALAAARDVLLGRVMARTRSRACSRC